jgi:hypothetical protein
MGAAGFAGAGNGGVGIVVKSGVDEQPQIPSSAVSNSGKMDRFECAIMFFI